MKKVVFALGAVTMAVSSALSAEELGTIEVESTKLSDVSGEEVKSADLADALAKKIPSISIVRRSGIANDIILRGQKKDNINILIDNTKVYGACPNRMDPPTSHILTHTIDSIKVIEGPYDVQNFGTLSGLVEITTKKPSKELQGEVSLNLGSFEYRKAAATVSGGNDVVRFLLSVSKETGAQYEDGDGNTFFDQIENLGLTPPDDRVQYKDNYRDIDAFDKRAVLGKVFIDITEDQDMRLSYTANRSDDVLYPSSKMDALYDDSNIFNLEYTVRNLGKYSKALDVQYYQSDVEHPMSTFYRDSSSSVPGAADSANEKVSFLTTDMQGIKIKDSFDLSSTSEMTIGFDTSSRNWDGTYRGEGTQAPITGLKSIPDVDTDNKAVFAEIEKRYSDVSVKLGARYDDTTITPNAIPGAPENDYDGLSLNVFATYKANKNTRYFGGIGKASRVPDARELYFRGAMVMMGNPMNPLLGTPTLDDTTNTEIDLGIENTYDSFNIKTKLFYSWLTDYIYYNADAATNRFENIDATIYGLEISGSYFASDEIYIDFGLAYQRGQKDDPLVGQTDTDLAEVPPLKVNIALNYDYSYRNTASVELVAVEAWDDFDSDNGEQHIGGYGVVNLKVKHDVTKSFELTAGVDNVADKTYATTNTYKDLTLLFDGTGDVMLINEPGRYLYLNGTYKF